MDDLVEGKGSCHSRSFNTARDNPFWSVRILSITGIDLWLWSLAVGSGISRATSRCRRQGGRGRTSSAAPRQYSQRVVRVHVLARRTGSPGPPHRSQISALTAWAPAAAPRARSGWLDVMSSNRRPRASSAAPRTRPFSRERPDRRRGGGQPAASCAARLRSTQPGGIVVMGLEGSLDSLTSDAVLCPRNRAGPLRTGKRGRSAAGVSRLPRRTPRPADALQSLGERMVADYTRFEEHLDTVFVYRVIRQQTRAESGLEARRFRRHRRGCLGRQCVHAGLLPPLRCRGGKPEASAPSAPASGTGGASKSLSRGCPPTRAAAEGRGARGRRVRRRATSRRSAEAGRGCAGGRCARRWPGPAGCRRRGGCGCRRTPCG